MMQSAAWKWFLLVGLCSIPLAGCSGLQLPGGVDPFGFKSSEKPLAPPTSTDPLAPTVFSTPDVGTSDPAKNTTLDGQIALARLCERRGEIEQAEQMYRSLLQKSPQDARLHHRLGVLAVRRGEFARAEEHFRTAQSLGLATLDLQSDIGYCLYLQQKLPEAEATLREAVKAAPNHVAATNNLALVFGAQGRYKESLDLFKRVNREAEAYANLGYVLAQNGDSEQAKQMYLHALTLDNTMRAAAQAMVQIEERERAQTRLASNKAAILSADAPPSVARKTPDSTGVPNNAREEQNRLVMER